MKYVKLIMVAVIFGLLGVQLCSARGSYGRGGYNNGGSGYNRGGYNRGGYSAPVLGYGYTKGGNGVTSWGYAHVYGGRTYIRTYNPITQRTYEHPTPLVSDRVVGYVDGRLNKPIILNYNGLCGSTAYFGDGMDPMHY